MKAKKSLGQHFLLHPAIAGRIAAAAELEKGDAVLEVGPGKGILTRALLARGARVFAVEADRTLVPKLQEAFVREIAEGQLEIVESDIRAFDLARLPRGYLVVANIPYYLTGHLLRHFLEHENQPRAMTLLVQKEVAERIARAKKESVLSLSVKAYGTPQYEFTVPRGAFTPAPRVDSAALSIRDISRRAFASQAAEVRFFRMVRAGFSHKRKLLSGNLAQAGFSARGVPPKARAEALPLSAWLALAQARKSKEVLSPNEP